MKAQKYLVLLIIISNAILYSSEYEKSFQSIINNINQIDCIYYSIKQGRSASGDSVIIDSRTSSKKFKFDELDTTMSCQFISFYEDTTKIINSYYRNIRTSYFWNNKTYVKREIKGKRPAISTPFFAEIKSMFKYIETNRDSVLIQRKEYKDSTKFTFYFNCEILFKKFPFITNRYEKSKYTLWIDSNKMPYKLRRHFSYQTVLKEIQNYETIKDFDILSVHQNLINTEGFKEKTKNESRIYSNVLVGKIAPTWELYNLRGKLKKLSDYNNKNILIEFTSITCGKCSAAIPILIKLSKDYKNDLEIISIFRSTDTKKGIQRYKKANPIKYEMLHGKKDTFEDYKVYGVPVFIFINEKGIIENTHIGFSVNKTEKTIQNYVEELCK